MFLVFVKTKQKPNVFRSIVYFVCVDISCERALEFLSLCQSVCAPFDMMPYLYLCFFTSGTSRPSVCPSVPPSIYPSIYPSIHLSQQCLVPWCELLSAVVVAVVVVPWCFSTLCTKPDVSVGVEKQSSKVCGLLKTKMTVINTVCFLFFSCSNWGWVHTGQEVTQTRGFYCEGAREILTTSVSRKRHDTSHVTMWLINITEHHQITQKVF